MSVDEHKDFALHDIEKAITEDDIYLFLSGISGESAMYDSLYLVKKILGFINQPKKSHRKN